MHIKRHAENCKPPESKKEQTQLTSHFNRKEVKLSDAEKLDIKNARLKFCVRGYHSFNSLENEGLLFFLQTIANIAGRRGRFDVTDVLYCRNSIASFAKQKASKIKESLKTKLVEPQETESVAITLDLWMADKQQNKFYLDVHAFWIDPLFKIKHQYLAIRHFGTERHTAENISTTVQNILNEYNIDPSKLTATTDHGANVVAAFCISGLDASARLDCMAHRLHTCFSSMWSQACSSLPELQDSENNASALARYCNQASGVQEQVPVSIKKGSTTRRWEGLIDRAHSINESYDALMHILSKPHRDRALLEASVNRRLNTAILKFIDTVSKII